MGGGASSVSFTLEDLLSKIGLSSHRPELMTRCQRYSMNVDSLNNFDCKIIDKVCSVPMGTCLNARPLLHRIEESGDGLGIL